MATQLISNRYVSIENLRSLLETKFGGGNFSILERDEDYQVTLPRELNDCRSLLSTNVSSHGSGMMESLRSSIEELRFKHENFEGRYFISEASLYRVVSRLAIKDSLKDLNIPIHEIQDLTNDILRGARRCFAILVLMCRGAKISAFFRRDSLQRSRPDSRLPYNSQALGLILGEQESSATIKTFIEKQWEFTIPVLHQNMISRELDTSIILPFLEEKRVGGGSMGVAWKIKIHPECHRLPIRDNMVIKKQIESGKDDDLAIFQKELENLSLLTHLKHPNIVQLFCSYSYRQRHNLIFAVAEGGSLADYLGTEAPAGGLEGHKLLLALTDLASAIDAVHNFTSEVMDLSLSGCHRDLAPRNILVSGGTLLLADFGLSTFKKADQDSLTDFKDTRGSHIAPESQPITGEHIRTGKTSRPSDIWSFGCILSEVLTHMVLGPTGVEQFRAKRRVEVMPGLEWIRFHKGPGTPSPEVLDWLESLRKSEKPFSGRLVNLIVRMLSIDPRERPKSAHVLTSLRGLSVLSLAEPIGQSLESLCTSRPSIDHILDQMRFQSWHLAFEQMLDTYNTTREEIPTTTFNSIVENLKEISSISEAVVESSNGVLPQRQPLFRYQQSKLLNTLTPEYQKIAKEHLIKLVLQKDDVEQLGRLCTAISELGDHDLGVLVAVKHLTALAEAGGLFEQDDVFIHQNDITWKGDVDAHSLAILAPKSQPVLVEWLKYKESWADDLIGTELRKRLTTVVRLLRAESTSQIPGSLHGMGVFHDPSNQAFGVVYSLPHPEAQPVTLSQLLRAEKGRYRPLLDHRFQLAFDICECIYTFHKVGWLHRNLHSMNVLFFPPGTAENTERAKHPRIVGFAGGRENRLDAFTHGPDEDPYAQIYQNPEYLRHQARYREEFDYYSIGILLLEIGMWSPLSKILDSKHFKNISLEEVRRKIIETRISQLGIVMGERYMEATRACLEGGFPTEGIGACYTAFKCMVMDNIPKIAQRTKCL